MSKRNETPKQASARMRRAWKTRKAKVKDYRRRALKAWRTKAERYGIGPWA